METSIRRRIEENPIMTRKKRRTYTDEQKSEAVRLAEQPHRSVQAVAEGLGIRPSLLSKWKQKYGSSKAGPTVVMSIDEKAELEALRRENKTLRQERDFLSKSVAFFIKPRT